MSSNLTKRAAVPSAQQIEAGAALYDISHPAQATKPKAAAPLHAPATAETVNNAIRWYRANEAAITQALPLHTPGVTFGEAWPAGTLAKYIQAWEAEALGLKLAEAYIINPLRTIKTGLNKQ